MSEICNPLTSDSSVSVGQGQPSGKGGKDWRRYKYKRVKIKQEDERSDYPMCIASPPNTGNGLGGSQAAGSVGAKQFTFLITNRPRLPVAEACPFREKRQMVIIFATLARGKIIVAYYLGNK